MLTLKQQKNLHIYAGFLIRYRVYFVGRIVLN